MRAYKNRIINMAEPVLIYRNLTRKGKVYSVKQFDKVVAHTEDFVITKVALVVNEKGRLWTVRNNKKIIHAYLKGYLGVKSDIKTSFSFGLNYSPFKGKHFYSDIIGDINQADVVYTKNGYLFCQI